MNTINLNHQDVLDLLPERQPLSHKGNFGRLLLLCGSCGYTGAAALAAMGALRVGAGLVYLGVPACIYAIEATKLLEPVVFPLPEENGMFSKDAINEIDKRLIKMDAVLIGPGIGQSEQTQELTSWLLQNYHGPVVVDADGINVLREHIDVLRGRTSPTILLPHEGEFKRLTGLKCLDRIHDAIYAARDLNALIVLKGHESLITDGQAVYVNQTGNPGMAVGGSGDVLAGIIVGLLGQGLPPIQAAAAGVWIHGAAGDVCADTIGTYGMLPSDMLDVIPRLLK